MKPETWGSFSPRLQIPITVFFLETAQLISVSETQRKSKKKTSRKEKKKDEEQKRKKEKWEEKEV